VAADEQAEDEVMHASQHCRDKLSRRQVICPSSDIGVDYQQEEEDDTAETVEVEDRLKQGIQETEKAYKLKGNNQHVLDKFARMMKDSKTPIYPNCDKQHTKLSTEL
jgi:hypothetical protein